MGVWFVTEFAFFIRKENNGILFDAKNCGVSDKILYRESRNFASPEQLFYVSSEDHRYFTTANI